MKQDDRIFAIVGGCVVSAVALVAVVVWLDSGIDVEPPQRATVVVAELGAPAPAASSASISPRLGVGSAFEADDALVRAAMSGLSSRPELASYLLNDRLLRRFVGAVDAIAGGYSPRDEIEFMQPLRPFVVREDEDLLVVASSSYRRYDRAAAAFVSIDVNGAVELFRRFRPQFEEIYRDIAWADNDFEDRLREAVDHLLEVEIPEGRLEVEQRAIVYAYAEDDLERLTGAQKQLLRMGPGNARAVQKKLEELRTAFGWPVEVPVPMTAPLAEPAAISADASVLFSTEPIEAKTGAAEAP